MKVGFSTASLDTQGAAVGKVEKDIKENIIMIYLGYISIAVAIGYLLGASNTPVVGAFITAFFGLIGTIVGAQYLFDKEGESARKINHVGVGITLVSVGLVCGTLIGEGYRNNWGIKNEKTLPWAGLEAPSITSEALDWIATSEKLKQLGYSDDDVKVIYQIRIEERSKLKEAREIETAEGLDEYSLTKVYESTSPYNNILSIQTGIKQSSRGPASID